MALVYIYDRTEICRISPHQPFANIDYDKRTFIFRNRYFIIYKHCSNSGRLKFTIAHEIGHIILFHLNNLSCEEYKQEANMFAVRILMPMCVIKEFEAYTPLVISSLCGVSITAATFRAERLQLLFTNL